MKWILAGVGALVLFVGVIVGGNELGFRLFQHYAPATEQVRRTTFEQSQAYVEGQRRDIANLRMDWLGAKGDQKAAIASVALQRIAGMPEELVTGDVLAFRNELQGSAQ
jgi:hypothetical protein